ncbi:hypothetical protein R3P38DRAFT_1728169 [Favolaschia claudopus]|uniref:Uncharacterized protein n=1 Tax=Favolaschia claudopus TaxID=2862362 RepID=A0AAW0ABP9_9AGAR
MRHVLRARVGSGESFGGVLQSAQSRVKGGGVHVQASLHLAKMYGGVEAIPLIQKVEGEGEDGVVVVGGKAEREEEGWREASKIIAFLTKRGAKIPLCRLRGSGLRCRVVRLVWDRVSFFVSS